jgi:hypothetical protein
MINEDFHKGERCLFSAQMCQEGYCSECIIFMDRLAELEESVKKGEEAAQGNTSWQTHAPIINR